MRHRKSALRSTQLQLETALRSPRPRKNRQKHTAAGATAIVVILCMYALRPANFRSPELHARQQNVSTVSLSKPLVVGCYFADDTNKSGVGSRIVRMKRLKVHDEDRYPSKRQVIWTQENEEFELQLRDSKKYKKSLPEQREDDRCELRYEWQKLYHPTCNSVHEHDFTAFYKESSTGVEENIRIVASGFWRDVWKMSENDGGSWVAAKTLRSVHPFLARNFDRHRRDAMATERTSASQHTVDMYSFCGHTMISEFADKGTLSDLIWPMNGNSTLSMRERLHYAMEVAKGLTALQFVDDPDVASIVHTDITPSQFLLGTSHSLKLNDFNRARFVTFDRQSGSPCTFRVGSNPGKVSYSNVSYNHVSWVGLSDQIDLYYQFRSPEEYAYETETAKIDVYSMGNVVS